MKKKIYEGKYCLIWCENSGIYAGYVERLEGQEAVLKNVRNLWYWEGANNLIMIALDGVAKPEKCKFSQIIEELMVTDVIQILPCTPKAENSIRGVDVWEL